MTLRILYVAYPLVPVTEASCGGAEQVLHTLERELADRGYGTTVAAANGSRVAGTLITTGPSTSAPDQFEARDREHSRRILDFLRAHPDFDLVHDMSGTFWKHAGEVDVPVLATLHLPAQLYPRPMFESFPPNLFFNCVSQSQARTFSALPQMLGVVKNGIDLTRFSPAPEGSAGGYLLWMGRICAEKGPHVALEVAEHAATPIIVAGDVYPFSYHRRFFDRELAPRLARNKNARFMRAPQLKEKLEVLRSAAAVLIPSLIDETSSLVAMEAMACGTPVIAFRRGALPEIIQHGISGFIVDSADAMAEAVSRVRDITPHACRERVERNFSANRMADDYEDLYSSVLKRYRSPRATAA